MAPRCHRVQCQAGVLTLLSPSSGLKEEMKSSLVPPLTCQDGKHGTELFKNRTRLLSCLYLQSNLQYVLGLYSSLNAASSRSESHPREPRRLQEAVRLRVSLVSCTDVSWAVCLTAQWRLWQLPPRVLAAASRTGSIPVLGWLPSKPSLK